MPWSYQAAIRGVELPHLNDANALLVMVVVVVVDVMIPVPSGLDDALSQHWHSLVRFHSERWSGKKQGCGVG